MANPMVIAAALAAAASVGGMAFGAHRQKRASKLKSKEMKRETYGDLLDQAQQRQSELEGSRLASEGKIAKARARAMMDTASSLRGSFQ